MTVGQRIKEARKRAGLSQRELATDGVSYAYISRIEAGVRTPSVRALRKIAPKLGVSVEWLETGRHPIEVVGTLESGLLESVRNVAAARGVTAKAKLRVVLMEVT